MTTDELRNVAIRWIVEGWQHGRADMVDELHSDDFVDRSAAGRTTDREGFKSGISDLYRAFPDFHAVVTDLVIDAEQSKVAVRWEATGTHRDTFMGHAATGRKIAFAGIEIIRIENGLIAERWGEWNGEELVRQLSQVATE